MLLITRATNDIELTECAADCEYVCFTDERESLGWGVPAGDSEWVCEQHYTWWAEEHGVTIKPSPTRWVSHVTIKPAA